MALTTASAPPVAGVGARPGSGRRRCGETARDPHRPVHRQVEAALVGGEVGGDHLAGAQAVGGRLERQAGQVVHAVRRADGERGPAVLPGTAGALVGVEDDEAGLRFEALTGQRPGGAQPGLAGADDDDLDPAAGCSHAGQRDPRAVTSRRRPLTASCSAADELLDRARLLTGREGSRRP